MKQKILSLFDEKAWKFLFVGILNTLVGNGLSFLLLNVAGWGVWTSSAVSYALASVMSYFLNRYFTFQYTGNDRGVILRFALNIAVCYGLAYGLAQPLAEHLLGNLSTKLRENIAMLVGMVLFVGFNYLGQRFFAFREKKKD